MKATTKKAFSWRRWRLARVRKLAEKQGAGDFTDQALRGVLWAASVPDFVAEGAGEHEGLQVANRPDLFETVFDDANPLAAWFWEAYSRQPDQVLLLLQVLRAKRRKDLSRLSSGDGLKAVVVREVLDDHPHEKVEVQLRLMAQQLGESNPNDRLLNQLRTMRREHVSGMKRSPPGSAK